MLRRRRQPPPPPGEMSRGTSSLFVIAKNRAGRRTLASIHISRTGFEVFAKKLINYRRDLTLGGLGILSSKEGVSPLFDLSLSLSLSLSRLDGIEIGIRLVDVINGDWSECSLAHFFIVIDLRQLLIGVAKTPTTTNASEYRHRTQEVGRTRRGGERLIAEYAPPIFHPTPSGGSPALQDTRIIILLLSSTISDGRTSHRCSNNRSRMIRMMRWCHPPSPLD